MKAQAPDSFSAAAHTPARKGGGDVRPEDVEKSPLENARHKVESRGARAHHARAARAFRRAHLLSLLALLAIFFLGRVDASAQRRMTKEYPAAPNVRLVLNNRSGTVEVVAWEKNKVKVTATMESSATRVVPQVSGDDLTIDIERENREDTGDVNFIIQVPSGSSVDIKTKRGNIIVRNIRGAAVVAKVSTEGDIELTGIRTPFVMAENIIGNILFDAELLNKGSYVLTSMKGDIQLRIDAEDGFNLTATAPRTRNINFNGFAGRGQFRSTDGDRRVVGKVGGGGALLNTKNGEGSIVLRPRSR